MIGLIGGSGIYEALDLTNEREGRVTTPFGEPSAPVTLGEFDGVEVAFLPRHGRDHQYSPTDVPYRANIYALKQVGVEQVLATNAVGSLREDLPPRTLVVPNQLFDRTRHREQSFFGDGIVVHMSVADPFCSTLAGHLFETGQTATDADVVEDGTYVCIEGPQFSTRAESNFYRSQGWELVGMTAVPEAKLAREAELCYATLTGITDYDVWKEDSEVTLEEVLENATANEASIKEVLAEAIRKMPGRDDCSCAHALEGAINTPAEAIPTETRERIELLAGRYLD